MATFGSRKKILPVPYSHKYCTVPYVKAAQKQLKTYFDWYWTRIQLLLDCYYNCSNVVGAIAMILYMVGGRLTQEFDVDLVRH